MRLDRGERPTGDINQPNARSALTAAIARLYGTLHRRLSHRFGRNLHNPEGELQLAEEVVDALSIGEKELTPAARVAFAHGVYYMEVLSMGPRAFATERNAVHDVELGESEIETHVERSHSLEEE
jgi:hypothetical protein